VDSSIFVNRSLHSPGGVVPQDEVLERAKPSLTPRRAARGRMAMLKQRTHSSRKHFIEARDREYVARSVAT